MKKTLSGRLALVFGLACASTISVGACSPSSSSDANACSGIPVERFKELIVVDDAVIRDVRAMNATDGPWSFRYAIENIAPIGEDPGEFVAKWLTEWATLGELNGYSIEGTTVEAAHQERALQMTRRILCPWRRLTPANACNDDCSTCTAMKLDLAKAPFRLTAINNRIDVRLQLDSAPSGESRLNFALTAGPADSPDSTVLPMAVVLEYALGDQLTTKQWAEAWHHLGSFPDFDDTYKAALESVTNGFVTRGSGSTLGQVRTNESALFWIWQLRQFRLGQDGELHLTTMRNTPHASLNGSKVLQEYITMNADAIEADHYIVPAFLLGGAADELQFTWSFPGMSEKTRRAFATGTCNGCHVENTPIDTAFHVSPFKSGIGKLSKFLNNPQDQTSDELSRRQATLRTALCGGR